MKPIFKEELEILQDRFNIILPTNCWKKKGGWVVVPNECNELINLGRLKSEFGGLITFKSSNRNIPKEYISHLDYCIKNKDYVSKIPDLSFLNNNEVVILTSTGKDSEVARHIVETQIGKRERTFTNTSLDVHQTYTLAKQNCNTIINPSKGFYQWVQEEHRIIPSRTVRKCCSVS